MFIFHVLDPHPLLIPTRWRGRIFSDFCRWASRPCRSTVSCTPCRRLGATGCSAGPKRWAKVRHNIFFCDWLVYKNRYCSHYRQNGNKYVYIYYVILCCILLYYIILYYIVLYHIILYYIILYNIMLYYMILSYIILYDIILYYIILY